ncbi:unnamed protein product [Gordionus sp. m RMFG-2023]
MPYSRFTYFIILNFYFYSSKLKTQDDTHGKGLAPEHAISVNNIPDNGIEPLTEIDYSVEYEDAPNITYGKIMPESIVTATNISEGLIAPQSVIDYSVEYEDDSPNGETSTDC